MRLPILLATAIAILAPAAAAATLAASDWYRVSRGDAATWYVDLASVRPKVQWTAARQYAVYDGVSTQGMKSNWSDVEIDCTARNLRYIHFTALDPAGAEMASMEMPDNGELHPIKPGTVMATIADYVCNVDRRDAVKVDHPTSDHPPSDWVRHPNG